MKIEIETKPIEEYKYELLEADLLHMKKSLKFEIIENLDNMKNNRTFRFKLMRIMKGISKMAELESDIFEIRMKHFKTIDLLDYKLENKDNLKIEIVVDNNYFDLNNDIVKLIGKAAGVTKRGMVKKIKHIVENNYKIKEYKILIDDMEEDKWLKK